MPPGGEVGKPIQPALWAQLGQAYTAGRSSAKPYPSPHCRAKPCLAGLAIGRYPAMPANPGVVSHCWACLGAAQLRPTIPHFALPRCAKWGEAGRTDVTPYFAGEASRCAGTRGRSPPFATPSLTLMG
jgi:hypothetical protein